MPIYGVVMDQAVSMVALGANALVTGYKAGQFLYSCSAIILVNPAAGSAGLYHFPSGDIYHDVGSQGVIRDLITDLAPTAASVVYGTYDMMRPAKPPTEPVSVGETNALCQWLQGQLGVAPTATHAIGGSAMVRIVGGVAQLSQAQGGETDLEGFAAGVYAAGYKVYWKPGSGPAPAPLPAPAPALAPAPPPAALVTRGRARTV